MSMIIFRYNSNDIFVQAVGTESISTVVQRFCIKVLKEKENLCFINNGTILNEELLVNTLKPNDENKIIILVNDIDNTTGGPCFKKSENIICPKCKESVIITVKDYKIFLSQCKNGHKYDNILFSKFNELQTEDISKIMCGICKKSKNHISGNKMFICITCKINLCILCKSIHDDSHILIDYDKKNYICENDGENFTSYCQTCKKNLCVSCENEHSEHDIIPFSKLMKKKNELIKQNSDLKKDIDNFKKLINDITKKLNQVRDNVDIFFDINKNLINSTKKQYRNYEELISINEINNNNTIQTDINNIINENNINNQINKILDIYDKMGIEEENHNQNNEINENIILNDNNSNQINEANNNIINNEQNQNNNINNNNSQIQQNTINTEANQNVINNEINLNNQNQINSNNNIIIENIENNNNINQSNNNNSNNSNNTNNIINDNRNNNNNNQINNNNNNHISNNSNNIITNTNNVNQNHISSTPSGDNNINIQDPDLDYINAVLNAEMFNQIRNEIDANSPLISESLDISTLVNDYQNNLEYKNSVEAIANKYPAFRKIRRDGNCFYRGYIYRIFEYICMNHNSSLYQKFMKKIEEAKDLAKKNNKLLTILTESYNLFLGEFCSCYNSLTGSNISCRDYLDKLFNSNNEETCNYLVLFIKYCIAEYIRENKAEFEAFIEGDFESWIIKEVEPIDKDADQVQITACVKLFDIGVKIEYLRKIKNDVIKYPNDANDEDIFIMFLFTPGHYDLLYDKK